MSELRMAVGLPVFFDRTTVKYVQDQAEHHKRISFANKRKKFLSVHDVEEIAQSSLRDFVSIVGK
jgi:hypothetical protein